MTIAGITAGPLSEVEHSRHRFWSKRLNSSVLATQAAGHQAFGTSFRYLATELELLNSEVTTGRH
jgi:hypothetical protein